MTREQMIARIKEKVPFVIEDMESFHGSFEVTVLTADGECMASGTGGLFGPLGPFTLKKLKARIKDEGEDAGLDFDGTVDIATAMEAAGARLKDNQPFYIGGVGTAEDNVELFIGETKDAVFDKIKAVLSHLCNIQTSLEEMDDNELTDFAERCGVEL